MAILKNSNGRGMRSTKPIQPIFKRNLYFIILHHPAKFHQIDWELFKIIDIKTYTQTHRHIHAGENKVFGQVIRQTLKRSERYSALKIMKSNQFVILTSLIKNHYTHYNMTLYIGWKYAKACLCNLQNSWRKKE